MNSRVSSLCRNLPAHVACLLAGAALLTFAGTPRRPQASLAQDRSIAALGGDRRPEAPARRGVARIPYAFEENQGQIAAPVRFLARGHGYTLGIAATEATLSLRKGGASRSRVAERAMVRLTVAGGNARAEAQPLEPLPGRLNYFLGSDPSKWRTNIRTFGRVAFREVYPGVDLHYYGNRGMLEYDFLVAPGADPEQIRLRFEGASDLGLNAAGDLVLGIGGGEVVQHRPVVYQNASGGRRRIEAGYSLLSDTEVAFTLAAYDPGLPLVIDPTLAYSTYLGGTGLDSAFDVAVDAAGAAYVTGEADAGFPTTLGSFQETNKSFNDVFVTKLAADGTMVYSTFIGGKGFDTGFAVTVDSTGAAYVSGGATSDDYPTTGGAYQRTESTSGFEDGVVSKLSPAGDSLMWSTYLGGNREDVCWGIGLDGAGRVFVAGETDSTNFPTSAGAFDATSNGRGDLFLARLDADGSALGYGTYLGGAGRDGAQSFFVNADLAVDTLGNAYVVATTDSGDFPTANPFQPALLGSRDAVVAKMNSSGSNLLFSTYLGGSGSETGEGIAIDGAGAAYVVGECGSNNFPVTPGAFDTTLSSLTDGYLTKFAPDGQTVAFSTLIGGNSFDGLDCVSVAPDGDVWVSGFTWSQNFPLAGAFQATFGGFIDCVVARFSPDLSRLRFSTYLGGPGVWEEVGRGLAIDGQGNVHIAGIVASTNWPVRSAVQPTFGGGIYDAFAIRIGDPPIPPADPQNLRATATSISSVRLTWGDVADNEESYEVERRQGFFGGFSPLVTLSAGTATYIDTGLPSNTLFSYRVRAVNRFGPSNYSNTAFDRTFPNPPADPTDLSVSTLTQTDLLLFWLDGSTNETGFRVQRRINGIFTTIGTTPANETSFVDSGLQASTSYTYRVVAFNADGLSGPTNEATGTTLPNRPAAPTRLTAQALSATQVSLEWLDNSDDEDGFKLERKIPGGGFAQLAFLSANVDTYVDNSVQPASTYIYRIRAVNTGGDSAFSPEATANTPVNPPGAPANLAARAVTSRRIDLTWEDPGMDETGIKIERRVAGDVFSQIALTGANVTAYSDTTVNPGSTYIYRVRAVNPGGDSPYSAEATATTPPDPPAAPSGLSATATSQSSIRLDWTDNSTNETSFKIERKVGAVFVEIASVPAGTVTFTETGLTPETAYTYRVLAVGDGGPSGPSNEATANTTAVPPAAPRDLRAPVAALANRVDLAWSDMSNNEDRFQIERRGAVGDFAPIGEALANVVAFTDATVNPDVTYVYRVRAVNAGGPSAYSNLLAVRTPSAPPNAPGNLRAIAIGLSLARLRWTDGSLNESGFRIERSEGEGEGQPYAALAEIGANVTTYDDRTVQPGIPYRYRVVAFNAGGASAPSNFVPFQTAAGGRLRVKPVNVGFGNVRLGTPVARRVELRNVGTAPLTVHIGASVAPFAVTGGERSVTLAAGQAIVVEVVFTPAALGLQTGTVIVNSSDDRSPTVTLVLRGKGVR